MARIRLFARTLIVLATLALLVASCGSEAAGEVMPENEQTAATATATAFPVPQGKGVPMAVVRVDPVTRVDAYSRPSQGEDAVGAVFATSLQVLTVGDETVAADGSTWRYVTEADTRTVHGWIDADHLQEVEGEIEQSEHLYQAASLVRSALSRDRPHRRLGEITAAIRVSADGVFSEADSVIEAWQLSTHVDSDAPDIEFNWGPGTNGDGDVIATAAQFFETLRNSNAIQATERVSINARVKAGGQDAGVAEFFPDAITVELYAENDDRWESVLLVFQVRDRGVNLSEGYELFGLAVDAGPLRGL